MKFALIALAAVLAAGPALASDRVSDVDFLKANRCKGLAASIDGVVDSSSLNSFVKAQSASRAAYIVERGDQEFQRARREAKSSDRRERLTAELTGSCQAYTGGSENMAKQATGAGKPTSDVSRQ